MIVNMLNHHDTRIGKIESELKSLTNVLVTLTNEIKDMNKEIKTISSKVSTGSIVIVRGRSWSLKACINVEIIRDECEKNSAISHQLLAVHKFHTGLA